MAKWNLPSAKDAPIRAPSPTNAVVVKSVEPMEGCEIVESSYSDSKDHELYSGMNDSNSRKELYEKIRDLTSRNKELQKSLDLQFSKKKLVK